MNPIGGRTTIAASGTVARWALVGFAALTAGCAALFPRADAITKSKWTSYHEAQAAFDQIVPHQTTASELKALG